MRTIKFRGKKSQTGEWIIGSLILNKSGSHTITQIIENPNFKGVLQGWCFGVDNETVGQFTGLTDKNAVEIYEGDWVKVYESVNNKPQSWENEVCFKNGCFSLVNRNCCSQCRDGFGITANLYGWNDQCEIIGNIYDKTETK